MDQPQRPADEESPRHCGADLPPGNHPLEIAARRGIGPLSPLAGEIWHGQAEPCVSCGQLVPRGASECDGCGQDLSPAMLEKMRTHAGPWYVLEHVRPFPGVSLERIIRQIRRGLITETSIVRGPSTDYQWRFAVEAPGLCRYFGRCWHCHEEVSPSDTCCQRCLSYLSFEKPRAAPPSLPPSPTTAPPTRQGPESERRVASPVSTQGRQIDVPADASVGRVPPTGALRSRIPSGAATPTKSAPTPADEIRQLSAAVSQSDLPSHEPVWDEPPRVAGIRATWVTVALLVVVIVVLMLVTHTRSSNTTPPGPPAPGIVLPESP